MGRQPYVTRVVLGRSAHQPPVASSSSEDPANPSQNVDPIHRSVESAQQYDRQGHPENSISRELVRESRRAQNEVLTTIGVCERVNKGTKSIVAHGGVEEDDDLRPAIRAIMKENEYGLFLSTTDWFLFSISNMCLLGLRQRMQVFGFYSSVPFGSIVRTEWQHFGAVHFLFAGTCLRSIYNDLMRRFVWRIQSPFRKQRISRVMDVSEKVLKLLAFMVITPLELFATLQRLDLVHAWPLFPHLKASVRLATLNIAPPAQFAFSMLHIGGISFLLSPLPLLWVLLRIKKRFDGRLFIYIRNALPSPSNPDHDSMEAAFNAELTHFHILGLRRGRRGFREMIKHDFQRIVWKLEDATLVLKKWLNLIEPEPEIVHDPLSEGCPGPELRDIQQMDMGEAIGNRLQPSGGNSVVDFSSGMQSSPPQEQEPQPSSATDLVESPDTQHLGEQLQAAFIADLPGQGDEAPHAIDDELLQDTRQTSDSDIQHHHVTALTAHMADTLAMHFSTHLADLIFLPLEALFVRSVALSSLSISASGGPSSPAARWRDQVIPLRSWFGMGTGSGGVRNYVRNMAMCGVFELAVGMGIWQFSTGAAWLLGRKRFGWGTFS
ncbi:MAG: hypothetical protein Q9191_001077 [Dirinaria sp. TL-2023a]